MSTEKVCKIINTIDSSNEDHQIIITVKEFNDYTNFPSGATLEANKISRSFGATFDSFHRGRLGKINKEDKSLFNTKYVITVRFTCSSLIAEEVAEALFNGLEKFFPVCDEPAFGID